MAKLNKTAAQINAALAQVDTNKNSIENLDGQVTQIAQNLNKVKGENSSAISDGKIEGGKVYTIELSAADDTLAISEIETSQYESVIYLTIGEDVEEPVSLPETYKSIGTPSFEAGKSYVIGVLNGILISNEVTQN